MKMAFISSIIHPGNNAVLQIAPGRLKKGQWSILLTLTYLVRCCYRPHREFFFLMIYLGVINYCVYFWTNWVFNTLCQPRIVLKTNQSPHQQPSYSREKIFNWHHHQEGISWLIKVDFWEPFFLWWSDGTVYLLGQ